MGRKGEGGTGTIPKKHFLGGEGPYQTLTEVEENPRRTAGSGEKEGKKKGSWEYCGDKNLRDFTKLTKRGRNRPQGRQWPDELKGL